VLTQEWLCTQPRCSGLATSGTRPTTRGPSSPVRRLADVAPEGARAFEGVAAEGARVLLLGLEELPDNCWAVLLEAGVRVEHVADVAGALLALTDHGSAVVIAGARWARALTAAVRGRRDLASAHIVVGAALDSPLELREAFDAGADGVMRVPFEPEVLVARVAAGLRAARLRANEALLRSLVANIPGALYRCAWDAN
jgi:CheY-like chemotaxis protein